MAITRQRHTPNKRLLAEMSEQERLVFVMVLYDGLNIREAALAISITPSEAKRILKRTINRFRSREILRELAGLN